MNVVESLTSPDFERVRRIAKARWGLSLNPTKFQLVSSRLGSFLRKATFSGPSEYLDHIESNATEQDLLAFFDILSTNVTSFFRDRGHFDYLERELLTPLARGNLTLPGKRLRIWSAGCSTGCEPYTFAMLVHDFLLEHDSAWDVQILATDLSNYAVDECRAGLYTQDEIKAIPRDLFAKHFQRRDDRYAVKPHLKKLVRVAQLNLMANWPMKGPFDVIFCRNVMIYFDNPTRQRLVSRFCSLLRPNGIFAVGSAESLAGMQNGLRPAMPSLYVK